MKVGIMMTLYVGEVYGCTLRHGGMKNGWLNDYTSGKRAFGLHPLVPASIWAGTKGPATSPQIWPPAWEALVPARYDPLVPV
jgi:hypothetical protein